MMSTTLRRSEPFGTVTYREAGTAHAGRAAPLVLLHGVGMQSAAWYPQIDVFSADRRVIALDLPGHGGTAALPVGAQLPEFVDWLRGVLDGLEIERVNLAGHSMGALVAGGFAVCHPRRLERVALLNGVFRRDEAASRAVIRRAKLIGDGSFDLETPLARWFGDSLDDRTARIQVADWLSGVDIDGYAAAYAAFANGDATYADGFSDIMCPLLALTGEQDPNSTPAMSRAMADAAPRGRAVIVKDQRHMVNLTAPEAVNAALREWLHTQLQEMDTA